jgi:hypothetical protein
MFVSDCDIPIGLPLFRHNAMKESVEVVRQPILSKAQAKATFRGGSLPNAWDQPCICYLFAPLACSANPSPLLNQLLVLAAGCTRRVNNAWLSRGPT